MAQQSAYTYPTVSGTTGLSSANNASLAYKANQLGTGFVNGDEIIQVPIIDAGTGSVTLWYNQTQDTWISAPPSASLDRVSLPFDFEQSRRVLTNKTTGEVAVIYRIDVRGQDGSATTSFFDGSGAAHTLDTVANDYGVYPTRIPVGDEPGVIVTDTVVKSLATVPTNASAAEVFIHDQPINFRTTGGIPNGTTTGRIGDRGTVLYLNTRKEIDNFKAISRTAGNSSILHVEYFNIPDDQAMSPLSANL